MVAVDRTTPIGEALRGTRAQRGLTQARLAQMAGLSDGMIGHVERGSRNLSEAAIDRIAEVLELTASETDELREARLETAGLSFSPSPQTDETVSKVQQLREQVADLERRVTLLEHPEPMRHAADADPTRTGRRGRPRRPQPSTPDPDDFT